MAKVFQFSKEDKRKIRAVLRKHDIRLKLSEQRFSTRIARVVREAIQHRNRLKRFEKSGRAQQTRIRAEIRKKVLAPLMDAHQSLEQARQNLETLSERARAHLVGLGVAPQIKKGIKSPWTRTKVERISIEARDVTSQIEEVSKPLRRGSKEVLHLFVEGMADVWEDCTGEPPTRSFNATEKRYYGPFLDLLSCVCAAVPEIDETLTHDSTLNNAVQKHIKRRGKYERSEDGRSLARDRGSVTEGTAETWRTVPRRSFRDKSRNGKNADR